ncbi:MAG: helix-turn-helix domain-containing protein [Syntrophobacterales bacterium]|nr:helix-turn-helix domain-containing protein [Syntrophobacterales bacterium]
MTVFYVGIKEIAGFLRLHPRTVYRHLKEGRLPAMKDCLGRWVLREEDYLRDFREPAVGHNNGIK